MNQTNSIARFAGRHRRTSLSEGYAAVFATVLIWSTPSLFMYYLNRYYDPWAQNFYRYFVACLAIAPLVFYRVHRGGPGIDLRAIGLCFVPCVPNVVHQVTQVMALFYMGPGVYTIFIRSSVIFTALLALAFFPEERVVIRQWKFQAGHYAWLDRCLRRDLVPAQTCNHRSDISRCLDYSLLLPPHFVGRSTAF